MAHLIPSKTQWRRWSLPSKLTCIGTYLAIFSIILAVLFYIWPRPSHQARHESGIAADSKPPVLSARMVRLGDGNNAVQRGFQIFNPSDFTVYDVALQFDIVGSGVRADTINIKMPDEDFLAERFSAAYQIVANAYTLRYDMMQEPTNQNILFVFGFIGAKERRSIEVSGTLTNKSVAKITLKNFKTNSLEIFRNNTTTTFYTPGEALTVRGWLLGNPPTNAVIYGNITNYPTEHNGKWWHIRIGIY
jgi:hypothetical protein